MEGEGGLEIRPFEWNLRGNVRVTEEYSSRGGNIVE